MIKSVTWIGFVSNKTKSVTGIGFVSDKKMSADFFRFSEG